MNDLPARFPQENKLPLLEMLRLKAARRAAYILPIILFLSLFTAQAQAEPAIPAPPPELYVLDQAGVISNETKTMILATSRELARQTKAQVAVVTLNSLEERPIEEIGLDILRQWKLGDQELNNGLLILVVPAEGQMRIEVGYGLEGALTDSGTGRIRDQYMLPAFKEKNYDLGIRQGYLAVVDKVAGEYNVSLNVHNDNQVGNEAPAASPVPTWLKILGILALLMLIWLDYRFLNGFIFGLLVSMLFRGGGRGGLGGGGFGGGGGSSGGGGSGGGGGSSGRW